MKKLALAAIFAAFAVTTVAAPALAEEGMHHRTVKKVIIKRDHGRHMGWRHHHDRDRHHHVKKVIIKHG
jgi:Ni/Co efflux regulator RcnB